MGKTQDRRVKAVPLESVLINMPSTTDIKQVREVLGQGGKNIKILAKIDTIHGVEAFEDILSEADGMILCRNELQWEI